MMGRLYLDMFCQERYLVNGIDVKLRLVRTSDKFGLMVNAANDLTPHVVLTSAVLFGRKIKLNPTVQLAHIKALARSPVKYPYDVSRPKCLPFRVAV